MYNSSDSSQECTRSSSVVPSLLSLAGGVGLGAGLLYLLDPDKGADRREGIFDFARNVGGKIADSAGSLASTVGSAAGHAYENVRDYAGDALSSAGSKVSGSASSKMADWRDAAYAKLGGESRKQHFIGQTICALGSMALGAALMYIFDPAMGRSRRRYVQEQAGNYARQASDTLKSSYQSAKDKVSGMTGMGSSGQTSDSSLQSNAPVM